MDALGLDVRFLCVSRTLRSTRAARVDKFVLGRKLGMVDCVSAGVVIYVSREGSLVDHTDLYLQMLAPHWHGIGIGNLCLAKSMVKW